MATWVPSPSYAGLIADCGIYTGPWPVQFPLEQNLPDDANEIDYIVALPNPDNNPDHVIDGTYPTLYTWSWINWTGVAGGAFTQHDVGGVQSSDGATGTGLPAGAHLFVIWYGYGYPAYSATPTPSKSPLDIIPQGWADGANGWASDPAGGHWSAWESGGTATYPALLRSNLLQVAVSSEGPSSGVNSMPSDIATELDAELTLVKGGATRQNIPGGEIAGSGVALGNSEEWTSTGFTETADVDIAVWSANVSGAQGVCTYDGAGFASVLDPPTGYGAVSSLIEGIDYGQNPTTGKEFDYESDTASFVGWENWDLSIVDYGARYVLEEIDTTTSTDTSTVTFEAYAGIEFRLLDSPLVTPTGSTTDSPAVDDFDTGTTWVAPGAGTHLATYTHDASVTDGSPVGVNLTVALGATGTRFSVVAQPTWLDATGVPWGTFSLPAYSPTYTPGSTTHMKKAHLLQTGLVVANLDVWCGTDTSPDAAHLPDFRGEVPRITYTTPRWRYWIPAFIAPKKQSDIGPFWPDFSLQPKFLGQDLRFRGGTA